MRRAAAPSTGSSIRRCPAVPAPGFGGQRRREGPGGHVRPREPRAVTYGRLILALILVVFVVELGVVRGIFQALVFLRWGLANEDALLVHRSPAFEGPLT